MAKGYRGGAGGFGGGANMNNMLKQVQKMQQEMQQEAEATEKKTVEASVGGGAVTVVMTGKHIIESVKIDPQVVDPDDVEMLEDLIMSAVNEASKKVDDMMESTMGKFTSGLNIPGMPGLF